MGNLGHADFRVPHGRRRIAVNRTKITLAVHQHVAQGKILSHTNNGVINS